MEAERPLRGVREQRLGRRSREAYHMRGDGMAEQATSIPRRPFQGDTRISILGFGGLMLAPMEPGEATRLVHEAIDRGVDYFDVGPTYPVNDIGRCEKLLGAALSGRRDGVFLACKTTQRDAEGARRELDESLARLGTDHFDLYQFHGVGSMQDVERILAADGAATALLKAREEGKFRHLGFSCHSAKAALALMAALPLDSVLFAVNRICYAQGGYGPQILAEAKRRNTARLAIKPLAKCPWPEGVTPRYPFCWYQPFEDVAEARQALRFTLSEDITSALPPADAGLFRMCLDLVDDLPPLSKEERAVLLRPQADLEPIFYDDTDGTSSWG